jgi:hypothetical protein
MTSDQIREALRASPFRSFELYTTGGRRYVVDHPELAVLSPNGRTMFVYVTPDAGMIIDVLMIESINFIGDGKRRKRSA